MVYGYYDNNVQFNKNNNKNFENRSNDKFNKNNININNYEKKSVSFADENNKPLETLIKIKSFNKLKQFKTILNKYSKMLNQF